MAAGTSVRRKCLTEIKNKDNSQQAGCRDFQEGAIVRIFCENFLTYDSVQINPGPQLNMIIGPNGTGKSSIVCAICLGLAGKTSVVGRATHVGDYVKHGCDRAVVEIELFNPNAVNTVITREIFSNNTSNWHLNKKQVTQRLIEETVSKLNIQVDNLCQFLPQDRVSDFAKMTSIELLENTEKAVGLPEMYENHCILKKNSAKIRDLDASYRNTKERLDREQRKNESLKHEVQNYHERQKIVIDIKTLKKKRPWVEYNEFRQQYIKCKEEKENIMKKYKQEKDKHAPLEKKINKKKSTADEIATEIKNLSDKMRDIGNKIKRKNEQIEEQDEKCSEVLLEFRSKKEDENERLRRYRIITQQLESMESELQNLENEEQNVQPLIDNVVKDMQDVSRMYNTAQHDMNNAFAERAAISHEITGYENALKQLQDIKSLRTDLLRKANKSAYAATQWLEQNQSRFRRPIHGPIMLTLNIKDNKFAKYVERHIAFNDLIAFVCEDKDDMNDFLRYVRDEQKLKINVVMMPREPVESFVPRHPVSHYKRWGFHSYVKDLFTAPDAVMAYLCRKYSVHLNLVGNNWTKDNVGIVLKEAGLNFFYTENHQYVVKRSRYGNHSQSTRCTELSSASLLAHSIDFNRRRELQSITARLDSERNDLTRRYESLKQEEMMLAAKIEDLRKQKKDLMGRRDVKKSIRAKINQKKYTISQSEENAININVEEEKVNAKILSINDRKVSLLEEMQSNMRSLVSIAMLKLNKSISHGFILTSKMALDEELRNAASTLQDLESECEEMKNKVKQMKDEAKRLLDYAKKATGTKSNEDLSDELRQSFMSLPGKLIEIDSMIHDKQAQADCLLQTDESVIEDFEKREAEIQKLKESVSNKESDIEEHQHKIEEAKQNWLRPLNMLVEKINKNFSSFLYSLGCAGEISVKHGDDPEDYAKYGISIKVKFRDNELLQELSPHQQSGGERSVATVLYMMALQELTQCPFRCVDEINQGMDSVNERRVFELVVRIACKENNSQYFLLTPKILPNLDYSDNMTIHCVYSGPRMIHHSKWNISRYLRRRSRL